MGLVTNPAFDLANLQNEKEPILVLQIEGIDTVFGSGTIYTKIRYDDPGVFYDGVYVYDGLRPLAPDQQQALIDRKGSSSTISQKLEQWDGKASIETFNIKLIDYQQVFTSICSPGQVIEDILNRKVKVLYGFRTISYPEDYVVIFQGYINSVKLAQGSVYFTFTDPSSKRKQALFNSSTSSTTAALSPTDTTVSVTSTSNFYTTITNALGFTDPGVTIGLVLDGQEIVTYVNAGIISGTQVNVARGQFGTTAMAHDPDVEVKMFIHFEDNPINIALKTMLSGWDGPWIENIGLRGIVNTDNGGTLANSVTFEQQVDVVRDYGLSRGDFIILSGSPIPANNGTFTVSDIVNDNRTVTVLETGILVQEDPPMTGDIPTVLAIRSKYDVYPIDAGLMLSTDDVFVTQFEYIKQTFVQFGFKMSQVGQENSGKTWIETNLFKSIGAYSLTQGSRISMGLTHAPLANDLTKFITPENVINAKDIVVNRGLNDRFFYNEVLFNYDYDVIAGEFNRSLRIVDADAQNRMRQVSVLELDMRGLDNSQASLNVMNQRAERILQRYHYAAETIELQTQFQVGSTIDAGDIAILKDRDTPLLQISNTETGSRGITARVMEVQERTIDISGGKTNLTLLSNNGFAATDRYGVIGPASQIDGTYANTNSTFRVVVSFGGLVFPGSEYQKWIPYQGSFIKVHDVPYANNAVTTFTLDPVDLNVFHVNPPLPFVPNGSFYVEFEDYNATDVNENALIKATYVSLDPVGYVFSASSPSVFVFQSGDSIKFQAGMVIYCMSPDGSRFSPDVKIITLIGDVCTVGPVLPAGQNPDFGFTPQPGDLIQLGGFKDGGSGYRLV